MSEKTVLNRLTIIENYVRGIYCKLTENVISTLNELTVKTKKPYTVTGTGNGIVVSPPLLVPMTTTEIKKQMLLVNYFNIADPATINSLEGYQVPGSLNTSVIGALSTLSYNNVDVLVLTAGSNFSIPTTVNKVFFPSLKYILGQNNFGFSPSGIGLNEISMPELEYIDQTITIPNMSTLTSFALPKLKIGGITNSNLFLTTLSLPEVTQLSYTDSNTTPTTSYNFPKLKILRSLNITGTKNSLTTISLPIVEWVTSTSGITFPSSAPALTSFTFGSSLKGYGSFTTNFVTTSNSLNQASVDNILISLAKLDGTNGTALLSGRTITITGSSATPSAAGLIAKATLVSRACTVTTN